MAMAPGSFMNLFRSQPAQNPQQQNPQQSQQQSQQQNNQQQGNPNGGEQQGQSGSIDPNNSQNAKNPFDVYAKLFDNTNDTQEAPPPFKLDPKLIDEASSQLDFTKGLPPELQTAVQGMGEQGQQIMALMNHMARKVYGHSLDHTTALTDKYLSVRSQHDQKGLGRAVKEQIALTGLSTQKAVKNPVIKKHLETVALNYMRANPEATPQEAQDAAIQYYLEVAKELNPQQNEATIQQEVRKQPGGIEFDWGNWEKT